MCICDKWLCIDPQTGNRSPINRGTHTRDWDLHSDRDTRGVLRNTNLAEHILYINKIDNIVQIVKPYQLINHLTANWNSLVSANM